MGEVGTDTSFLQIFAEVAIMAPLTHMTRGETSMKNLFGILVAALMAVGCGNNNADGDGDGDADENSDTNIDDTDTDTRNACHHEQEYWCTEYVPPIDLKEECEHGDGKWIKSCPEEYLIARCNYEWMGDSEHEYYYEGIEATLDYLKQFCDDENGQWIDV